MAWWEVITISVYNKTWNTLLFTEDIDRPTLTIWELLGHTNFVNNNITEISNTIWWQPLNHSDNPSYYTYYDVTPEPETITGFFLDWQEYQFAWGGWGGGWGIVDDTPLSSSWDWDTTHAPSKNAVYDAIWNIETLLAAL